jgi:pimeloyl-ACP methyl ester carboxylesterase
MIAVRGKRMHEIVFLHGFGLDGRVWRAQREAFPRSIAPDVPGFGSRQVDGTADLGELEGEPRDAHVVGHSLGAAVAVDLALRLEGRVRSLTLVNPLLLGRAGKIASWPTCVERAKAGDIDGARKAWLDDALFSELNPAARVETTAIVGDYRCAHWAGRTITGFRFTDPLEALAALELPVLVVSSQRDLPSFRAMADEYARVLPRAKLEVLDAGHMAPLEKPDAFNVILRAFIDNLAR